MINKPNSERGSATVKLLAVLGVLLIAGNALLNLVPVAYNGENFKQEMQTAVVQGMVVPVSVGNPLEVTKKRLKIAAAKNQLPADAFIDVKMQNNVLQVHASYSQPVPIIPFGIYSYTYTFNHTATPSGFFTRED
ncbi:MAG: hypothetical protein IPN69_12685 [Acidobacteria bacterium]|nr:hypothetical protein [Acidobacteriota bacterium]MBK8149072.1 hypothetical protein [Acidobacteriota bacterium]MBK8811573.1 hypothetical protein [Acidobacteriota bacterium]